MPATISGVSGVHKKEIYPHIPHTIKKEKPDISDAIKKGESDESDTIKRELLRESDQCPGIDYGGVSGFSLCSGRSS